MNWLNKLPGSKRSASGLEWRLWRRLPLIFAVGTAVPLVVALGLHWLVPGQDSAQQRWLQLLDYCVIGVLLCHWTAVLTAAIGCVVVMLMKGPGYVADAMELSDSERPRRRAEPGAPGAL